MDVTFLLSIFYKIYIVRSQKVCLTQCCEGAGNHSLHEANENFPKWTKVPYPRFFWQAGGKESRIWEVEVVGGDVLKPSLEWQEWLGKLALGFIFGVFAEGGGHTSQFFPFLVNRFFLEQNRDRPAWAFWSVPWGIQIVRGRWEAAERQLEAPWAVCRPALHPLFPLWSAFLLLHSQQGLQVPCHMYPLENIYNWLTSWGPIFF